MFKYVVWLYPLAMLLWVTISFVLYCVCLVITCTPTLRLIYLPWDDTSHLNSSLGLTWTLFYQGLPTVICFMWVLTPYYPDAFIGECTLLGIPAHRSLKRWLAYFYVFLKTLLIGLLLPLVVQLVFKGIFTILPLPKPFFIFGVDLLTPFMVAVAIYVAFGNMCVAPLHEQAREVAHSYLSEL